VLHTAELFSSAPTIQAVYPSARRIALKVCRFVDYLAEVFGDEPPWDRKEVV